MLIVLPPCPNGIPPVNDPPLQSGERWYVVYTHARCEMRAKKELEVQGFKTFLPRFNKVVRHARQVKHMLAPLFPRYLFVSLDLERDRWHRVNGTLGVVALLAAGERPLPVQRSFVETLKTSSSPSGTVHLCPEMKAGQTVRLVAGPFAEQLGTIQDFDDHDRVRVLLELMGGHILVSMKRKDLYFSA